MRHTILVLEPGEDGGVALYGAESERPLGGVLSCRCPREVRDGVEAAYRRRYGVSGGEMSYSQERDPVVREDGPGSFVTDRSVEASVYRRGADGVLRKDESSTRVLRVVMTQVGDGPAYGEAEVSDGEG